MLLKMITFRRTLFLFLSPLPWLPVSCLPACCSTSHAFLQNLGDPPEPPKSLGIVDT